VVFGEHDEDLEEVFAVFGGGREIAADRAELFGSGEGAETARGFLPPNNDLWPRSWPRTIAHSYLRCPV